MEEILGKENTLAPCQDSNSSAKTANQLMEIAFRDGKENWLSACPVPCKQTSYDANIRYFHKSAVIDTENSLGENFSDSKVMFALGYETLLIEEHAESLVYDVTNFLAAAGGNLGLFLGFSCMSIFYGMIKIIMKFNVKKKYISTFIDQVPYFSKLKKNNFFNPSQESSVGSILA